MFTRPGRSIAGVIGVATMVLGLSCNQIRSTTKGSEIETAPSIESERNHENSKEPMAAGGDLVFDQVGTRTPARA